MTAQGYHEREANQLLAQAATVPAPGRLAILAEAQVHASLAVAAEVREANSNLRALGGMIDRSTRGNGIAAIRNRRRD